MVLSPCPFSLFGHLGRIPGKEGGEEGGEGEKVFSLDEMEKGGGATPTKRRLYIFFSICFSVSYSSPLVFFFFFFNQAWASLDDIVSPCSPEKGGYFFAVSSFMWLERERGRKKERKKERERERVWK